MAFEGDLSKVSLESVLRNIDSASLSGILAIKDALGERRIAFVNGRITAFSPIPSEERSVPEALAKKGLITKDEVEKVRTSLAWKRMNLRRALEYRGLVKEQDYAQAVRDEVIVQHFLELFLHPERTFRFDDKPLDHTPAERDRWDQDQLAAELRVTVESVVLDVARLLMEKHPTARRPSPSSERRVAEIPPG